jgi:NAD(P)-dependent dehydrogenase (short-subunit alcohol dehydrogenase family)
MQASTGRQPPLTRRMRERVVRTKILGEYCGSWVALRHFLAQGTGGKLINLLGRGHTTPVALQNAYASSKAWVRHFTLALAKAVRLASGATLGEAGLVVHFSTPRRQLAGLLGEPRRWLNRQPPRDTALTLRVIAPSLPEGT